MSSVYLWESETEVREFIRVPAWIESDITGQTVAAIVQGGCSSGAYMPAVTYWQANETMAKHGDNVLQYIEDALGELPAAAKDTCWSGLACHYLSGAVDLWAYSIEDELAERIESYLLDGDSSPSDTE